jgi:hypothetical protein
MRKFEAYAFESDLTLEALFARLNEGGPWRWSRRDGDRYGDYLATRALPDYADPTYAFFRIFEVQKGQYAFGMEYRSNGPDADHVRSGAATKSGTLFDEARFWRGKLTQLARR